ncbi:MAG TPA: type II toxin-antitoxin system VapC family toxin [Aestuariivirga sp.]|nr:type II toxin-antitoxin system VapC family toxin [Aestuariivirga sp.]
MFVDASAIIGIIAREPDEEALRTRLRSASRVLVSPIVTYEGSLGLARRKTIGIGDAISLINAFLSDTKASDIAINAEIGHAALAAFSRFGKGRHRASLNMGDCFAYACAKIHRVPLLCKGDDFVHTDIRIA